MTDQVSSGKETEEETRISLTDLEKAELALPDDR
jgi:hypothetical protein